MRVISTIITNFQNTNHYLQVIVKLTWNFPCVIGWLLTITKWCTMTMCECTLFIKYVLFANNASVFLFCLNWIFWINVLFFIPGGFFGNLAQSSRSHVIVAISVWNFDKREACFNTYSWRWLYTKCKIKNCKNVYVNLQFTIMFFSVF